MWLTISGVSIVAGIILYLIWRRSEGVGSLADWTIVLIGSSIAAPMLGEIGQSAGSVTTGAGSASATTVIAYVVLGVVVVVGGALLLRLHTRD
jgi:integral membrane sensor domain MASE1